MSHIGGSDIQNLSEEWLRSVEIAPVIEKSSEIIDASPSFRVVRPEGVFSNLEGLSEE